MLSLFGQQDAASAGEPYQFGKAGTGRGCREVRILCHLVDRGLSGRLLLLRPEVL